MGLVAWQRVEEMREEVRDEMREEVRRKGLKKVKGMGLI